MRRAMRRAFGVGEDNAMPSLPSLPSRGGGYAGCLSYQRSRPPAGPALSVCADCLGAPRREAVGGLQL